MFAARPLPEPDASSLMTWDEWLEFEDRSEVKHEFRPFTTRSAGGEVLGKLVAMTGTTVAHNLTAKNIARILDDELLEKDCHVYQESIKTRLPDSRGVYPDVMAVCGERRYEPRLHGDSPLVLLNPQVIFEISSESTDGYDRGDKGRAYRDMESVREYFIVPPDGRPVDRYRRAGEDWVIESFAIEDGPIPVATFGVAIPWQELLRKVDLEDEVAERLTAAPRSTG